LLTAQFVDGESLAAVVGPASRSAIRALQHPGGVRRP
jgi:hypothetical protein